MAGREETVVIDDNSNISRVVKPSLRAHASGISASIYILFTRRAICPRNSNVDERKSTREVFCRNLRRSYAARTEDRGTTRSQQTVCRRDGSRKDRR